MSIITLTMLAMAQSLQADPIREIDQTELRLNVTSGNSVGMGQVLNTVHDQFDGDAVDVRAFEAGGIYYRILIRLADGHLHSVIVEARSGVILSPDMPLVRRLALSAAGSLQITGHDDPSTSVSKVVKPQKRQETGDNI